LSKEEISAPKKHPFETNLWKILSTIGAVSVVVATATWNIAQVQISNELQSYRSAKEWNVQTAIKSISELSQIATIDTSERKELIQLREQTKILSEKIAKIREKSNIQLNEQKEQFEKEAQDLSIITAKAKAKLIKHQENLEKQYKQKLQQLSEKLNELVISNTKLSVAYKQIVSDSFTVDIIAGEAKFVIPNSLIIGVQSVYGSFATVKIGRWEIIDMHPGESKIADSAGMPYKVTLMKITKEGCIFMVNTNS
jgi:hypothetical protein